MDSMDNLRLCTCGGIKLPGGETTIPLNAPITATMSEVSATAATPVAPQGSAVSTNIGLPNEPGGTNNNKAPITWFKHILAVDSALRIGDVHFADSLLSILQETAKATDADISVRTRLKSLQARVLLERRQFNDAQDLLEGVLQSLQGSAHARCLGAAYCLHVLAQCNKLQNKPEQAKALQAKAVSIAQECLGTNDPEVKFLKQEI